MLWVKCLLGMAWLLALAPSTMQLLLWSAFTPPGSSWQQCTTVWFIAMYEKKVGVWRKRVHARTATRCFVTDRTRGAALVALPRLDQVRI